MRTSTTLLLSMAVIGSFASCSKEDSPNEGTELLRIRARYDDGTLVHRSYIRNNDNKIVQYRDSIANDPSFVSWEYGPDGKTTRVNWWSNGDIITYFTFEYNPDGTIKKKQQHPGTIPTGDDISTYTYDAAGRLIIDSTFQWANNIWNPTRITNFMYTGDNVTEVIMTHGFTTDVYRAKFEYDDGLNPFFAFKNFYQEAELNGSMQNIRYASRNNVVKEYYAEGTDPYQLDISYTYQYNSSKYPWKVRPDVSANPITLKEVKYWYK